MSWQGVGDWLKNNGGKGAALVGSLLVGNVPGAVAAGVSMVSSATGTDSAEQALSALQGDPTVLVRLREIAAERDADVRRHIETMARLQLESDAAAHATTQQTIRAGDRAEDKFVRWTRPGQSWFSLFGAFLYVAWQVSKSREIDTLALSMLLTLPWAYAGLREVGKGVRELGGVKLAKLAKSGGAG